MKSTAALSFTALLARSYGASVEGSPIAKVLEMISDLQSKIVGEGEEAQKVYAEFSEWCEEQAKNIMYEIKTGKNEVADLEAVIGEESSIIESLTTKVEELSGKLSAAEEDLKAATSIRKKEASDFAEEEKESTQTIDTLSRAIGIMQRGGASMLQLKGASNLVNALSAMVQASAINAADGQRLAALVQAADASDDADSDMSAPTAANYESHSGGILETLQGLLDKAQSQLDDSRKKEQDAIYAFEALQQALNDKIRTTTSNLEKSKKGIAQSSEKKATADGELSATAKDLHSDESTLAGVHHDCMTKASDFESETKSRDEELAALATAKKVIAEATGGALNQVSLLQTSMGSGISTMNFKVVKFVRQLSQRTQSSALAQLAARMATVIRLSGKAGDDPFAKIKGLIRDMITKLEKEAEEAAGHKQYCDKEMGETQVKHEDKSAEIEKLENSIEMMSAQSAKLKEEVATLQKELADLAFSQSEMDRIRKEENTLFVDTKAELDKGLNGIKLALKVLNDYYGKADKAHDSSDAAGGGIIDLLETVETDFEKSLAEATQTEQDAQAEYTAETKQNELSTTVKSQDVKYKTQESTDLDKAIAESSEDLAGVRTEISAVNEYWAQIKNECIEKVSPYAEKVRRRNEEIAGLKDALETLSDNAVLLQEDSARQRLRGVQHHVSPA